MALKLKLSDKNEYRYAVEPSELNDRLNFILNDSFKTEVIHKVEVDLVNAPESSVNQLIVQTIKNNTDTALKNMTDEIAKINNTISNETTGVTSLNNAIKALGDEITATEEAISGQITNTRITLQQNLTNKIATTTDINAVADFKAQPHTTGDLILVVEPLHKDDGDNQQITPYVYNYSKTTVDGVDTVTSGWLSLGGQYRADRIYIPEDIIISKTLGKYVVEAGNSTTLPWGGKTLMEALQDAFCESVPPGKSEPTMSFSWAVPTQQEVGTLLGGDTEFKIATISLNVGGYTTPNQASKVKFSSLSATITATQEDGSINADNLPNGNLVTTPFEETYNATTTIDIYVQDPKAKWGDNGTTYEYSYNGQSSAGVVPKDNLNNDCTDMQISAKTFSKTATPKENLFVGYRNWWYGYVKELKDTGNIIERIADGKINFNGSSLTPVNKSAAGGFVPGCSDSTGLVAPADAAAFVVLVPHTSDLAITSGISFGVSNVNMDKSYFTKAEQHTEINGANGYKAVKYDLLSYKPQKITGMTISFTLGKDE